MIKYKKVTLHLTSGKNIVFRNVTNLVWSFESDGPVEEASDFGGGFMDIDITAKGRTHIFDIISGLFGKTRVIPDMKHICAISIKDK